MSEPRTDTPERIPLLSLVFGYGPVLAILLAGALALAGYETAVWLGHLWAAAILIFLAGVVRGLSFFTAGGPRLGQVLMMLWRFLCGLVALAAPPTLAFVVLSAGYLSVPVYDVAAARQGGAPRYFARLRPPQTAIALLGLVLLFLAAAKIG